MRSSNRQQPRATTTRPSRWGSYASRNDPDRPLARILFYNLLYHSCVNLLQVTKFSEAISILELGCGPSYIARRIAERYPTRRLVVVDNDPTMIEISKKVLRGLHCDVEIIEDDFFQTDLPERFDLVYSNGVVEHFDEPTRSLLLDIHANHLDDGGYCLIHVPTPTLPYRFLRALSCQFGLWEHEDETPLPAEQLSREMTRTGLEVLKKSYYWRLYLTQVGIIGRRITSRGCPTARACPG